VGLGEQLEVALAFLECPFAVLGLMEFQVALNDIGDPKLTGGRVVLGVLDDLPEQFRRELGVGGVLVALEQSDTATVDIGTVGVFVRGVPGTCDAGHE
jgi:hypothetical protein